MTELLLLLFLSLASCPWAFFWAACPCCVNPCAVCTPRPNQWQVVISGLANATCTSCSSNDGTYIIPNIFSSLDECIWQLGLTSSSCYYIGDPLGSGGGNIRVTATNAGGQTRISVRWHYGLINLESLWYKDLGATPIDCASVSSESLPWNSGGGTYCDGSGATCVVTAIP